MRVLIAGSSGLIGSELTPYLKERGFKTTRLVRDERAISGDALFWQPGSREICPDDFEDFTAVVNLAGENIASGRWTRDKKRLIRESRIKFTHMLSKFLAGLRSPPKLLINASAVGFYGSRPGERLTEKDAGGRGFLAEVCREWEEALSPASKRGIRTVSLRIGIVLSAKGGALKRMLTSFRLGCGGKVSTGRQYMSWIAIEDLTRAIHYIMDNEEIGGPVNAVSPNPVTNTLFTAVLGKVLRRPTIFPLPAFVAKIILGREMARELLLSDIRAYPEKLLQAGFSFCFPDLEKALRHILK